MNIVVFGNDLDCSFVLFCIADEGELLYLDLLKLFSSSNPQSTKNETRKGRMYKKKN
jgi:hypothetical protein